MSQLHSQLREGSVVLGNSELERFSEAVAKLAAATTTWDDQLGRLRMAFSIQAPSATASRFDEQLSAAGAPIDSRQTQLRRVLAGAVLVARFGRPPGRRSSSGLAPDTAAALGARLLARNMARPVHPDLVTWADYWIDSLSMHLRESRKAPSPPSFEPELPAPNQGETSEDYAKRMIAGLRDAMSEFTGRLTTWSAELDPASVRAQGEQIDLLWWLAGGQAPEDETDLVVWAARGLRRHSRNIPGPPRLDQLLRRRLGDAANKEVELDEVAVRCRFAAPDTVRDFCALASNEVATGVRPSISAIDGAIWVYDELSLIDLFEEEQ